MIDNYYVPSIIDNNCKCSVAVWLFEDPGKGKRENSVIILIGDSDTGMAVYWSKP